MKRISILWACVMLLASASFAGRYSTIFEREDCPGTLPLKYVAYIFDNKLVIDVLNESNSIYKLDVQSSFLFIPSRSWQSSLTDTHKDRPSSTFLIVPQARQVSFILFPQNLIEETDAEFDDVDWFQWPCAKESPIPMARLDGQFQPLPQGQQRVGASLECQVQMTLVFIAPDGAPTNCKMEATLLKKRPKQNSKVQRYR